MPSQHALVLLAIGGAALSTPAAGQSSASHYRPQPDTLYYQSTNPYHMFWVRGTDTLGGSPYERSVIRQVWRGRPGSLDVREWSLGLNLDRAVSEDTFELSAQGRVVRINGLPPGVNTRVDLVPAMPAGTLRAGTTWADTLSSEDLNAGAIKKLYQVIRTWRVDRVADSAGRRRAHVSGSGTVRYRDGFIVDSASRASIWLDVKGPVTERFTFDLTSGRVETRAWEMKLAGIGGIPNAAGGYDTLPAGLNSAQRTELISREKAALLSRPLPGADTSITRNQEQAPVLLHTVHRGRDTVTSGFARNDGLVGTATTAFAGRRPRHFTAVWTDSAGHETRYEAIVEGSSLRLRGPSGDSVVPTPVGFWGIADYAMEEHLVPMLLEVPADSMFTAIALYRPVPGRWEEGTAALRRFDDFVILTLSLEEEGPVQYLLISNEGDLLYQEGEQELGRREPAPGARGDRLAKILKSLQAQP